MNEVTDLHCKYSKCLAIADFATKIGNYCGYHFEVIKKKEKFKSLKGGKIQCNRRLKERFAMMQKMKNFGFVLKVKDQ